ncbi:unnamed protein product [Brachionus calyciflorus]|uniref:Uncharacterized protein n=1 Tax=Brachionus calyciflorus TaxID=104777 RepID=A0A813NMB6_9BILA|nr:unnamed protein product [Brachionus calyciflorus]
MALDASQKAKLQEKKLQKMYNKRAKVTVKDLDLFKLNLVLLIISIFLMVSGTIVIGVLLGAVEGQNAISEITNLKFDPNSLTYSYYVGSHIGAVITGLGIFILILCLVGFIDDYLRTKKRLIEKIIKEDQEKAAAEAAKNANMNIFQMLARNIKNSHLAN